MIFAHSLPRRPESDWEPLSRHLTDVAAGAAMRASAFGAEDCAAIAGLLHDLGKAKPAFQAYIRGAGPHEPHAGEGALFYSLPRTSSGAMR